MNVIRILVFAFFLGCTSTPPLKVWNAYDESAELQSNQDHPIQRMRYKRIQSQHTDRNQLFQPFAKELASFTTEEYERLKPFILEQNIPTIQDHIRQGDLTYEVLTLFYLYRIYTHEMDRDTYLNALISLNPNIVKEARLCDRNRKENNPYSLFGMPILIKDNIDVTPMATTAGAAVFRDNYPKNDAFIIQKIRQEGGLILGKLNLSEWAYYFCQGCPVGNSAQGGQTLNPYGRRQFETGGSSSGSGVAVAANYAVAALGSETSGSILSPSGKNSVVGLKPTIGAVSRSGIVPISSSLDTAGPMAKNIIDAAILYNTIIGLDSADSSSFESQSVNIAEDPSQLLKGKRLGLLRAFEGDSLMQIAITKLKEAGAEVITIDPPTITLTSFRTLLDVDMAEDLPLYIQHYAGDQVQVKTVADIVNFNRKDSLLNAPYGQEIFERVAATTITKGEFEEEKRNMMAQATSYFSIPMKEHQLDAVLSIDNRSAGFAAMAHYPALGVPMGYSTDGEPQNITFIAPSKQEALLFELGAGFENVHPSRKAPNLFP